jgi:hypothetical protein
VSSLVVAGFGAVLVASAPAGPGPGGGAAGWVVIRCARRRRTSPGVKLMRPLPGLWGGRRRDREVGVGEHGQGDVPVPGVVAADLIVVQSGLGLGGLEALPGRPPRSGDADQLLIGGGGRGGA